MRKILQMVVAAVGALSTTAAPAALCTRPGGMVCNTRWNITFPLLDEILELVLKLMGRGMTPMIDSTLKRLAMFCAGAILGAGLTYSSSSHASLITYDFTATMINGSQIGNRYLGSFTYDNSLLDPPHEVSPGIFVDRIDSDQLLDVAFDYKGTIYTESSTPCGPFGITPCVYPPLVQLENGSIVGANFAGLFWNIFPGGLSMCFSLRGISLE